MKRMMTSLISNTKFNSPDAEIKSLLKNAGYEWHQAPNGERALLPIDKDTTDSKDLSEREAELFSQLPEDLKEKLATLPNSFKLSPLPNAIQSLKELKKIDPNTL